MSADSGYNLRTDVNGEWLEFETDVSGEWLEFETDVSR